MPEARPRRSVIDGRLTSLRATVGAVRRTTLSATGVRGAALELAWVGAHYASFPLGLRRDRTSIENDRMTLDDLPPIQRGLLIGDVVAAGTPIVLLHGLMDNRAIFAVLRRQLKHRGFGRIITHSYSILTSDIRAAAERLGREVERLCEETGYERIHVVGHSMGGLIARYYVQRLGGDKRIHTLVTLGTPHEGTVMAKLLPTPVCRQLRPGSDLLAELEAPAPGCRTRFLAVWSDLDELVVPQRNATINHPDLAARNVLVRGVGHVSLPISARIVREIASTLAHLDIDGSTVAAGVTPIASRPPEPATSTAKPKASAKTAGVRTSKATRA